MTTLELMSKLFAVAPNLILYKDTQHWVLCERIAADSLPNRAIFSLTDVDLDTVLIKALEEFTKKEL